MRVQFIRQKNVLCQQGVNAGMSQQDVLKAFAMR